MFAKRNNNLLSGAGAGVKPFLFNMANVLFAMPPLESSAKLKPKYDRSSKSPPVDMVFIAFNSTSIMVNIFCAFSSMPAGVELRSLRNAPACICPAVNSLPLTSVLNLASIKVASSTFREPNSFSCSACTGSACACTINFAITSLSLISV